MYVSLSMAAQKKNAIGYFEGNTDHRLECLFSDKSKILCDFLTIWQNYVNFIYECKCKPIFFCFLTGVINLHIQFLIYLLIIASNECQKNRNLSMSNYLQNLSLILHLLECVHHFCQNIALSAASNQSHNWWHNCFSFEY